MTMMFPETVGIVGYGDFGQFLHRLGKELLSDVEMRVYSRGRETDGQVFFPLSEVCASEVLLLAVPIAAFESLVAEIRDLISPETIVCDVATVKMHTVEVLRRHGIKRFIATHPMFGPYSYEKHDRSLEGLRLTVCDHTLEITEYEAAIAWLRSLGLEVLEMSAEEHYKNVAETLFLTHLIGQIVKRGGFFARTAIDTVSFGFLMDAVESVAHDEALFKDVYKYNPYCKEVLERFKLESENVGMLLK